MKQLIHDIMSGKIQMDIQFGEVAYKKNSKRCFLEVFVDGLKYPEYNKNLVKINVFGVGFWIFDAKSKEEFLKIAKENLTNKFAEGSVVQETGELFDLDSLNHLEINNPVGIVEVALSSGMRNEFLYADTDGEFVKFFDEWYRSTLFATVREKYNVTPVFKSTQIF